MAMLVKLENNTTPKEYSASGLELGAARTRIMASWVAQNHSLCHLHLSRAQIKDEDGAEIAKILYTNKTLRKLELEGNQLGPKSATVFGKALIVNTTLQALDLENNSLTNDSDDAKGMIELIHALSKNTTLISLNLGNNKLEQAIGLELRKMLEQPAQVPETYYPEPAPIQRVLCYKNTSIIDLEIAFNNFTLEDVSHLAFNLVLEKGDPEATQREQASL